MIHSIKLFYFPKGLRYTTPLFVIISLYVLYLGYWVIALAIALVSVFILTAYYITGIDTNRKEFTDSFSFLGIRVLRKREKFNQLQKIEITKERYAQTVNTRAQSRVMRWSDYTATLIYDDNKVRPGHARRQRGCG